MRLYHPLFPARLRENLGMSLRQPGAWRRLQVIRVSTPYGDVHVAAEDSHAARAIVDRSARHPEGRLVFYPDSAGEVTIPYYRDATYQLGSDPYTHSDTLEEWYVIIDALEVPGLLGQITGNATIEYRWRGQGREICRQPLVSGQTMCFSDLVPMRLESWLA